VHCHTLEYCVALESDKQREREKEDGYHGRFGIKLLCWIFNYLQIQNQQNWRKLLEYLANVLFDNHFDCQGNLFPSKIL